MAQVSKASKNVYLEILCTSFISFLKIKKDSFFISYKNYFARFFIFVFISFAVLFLSFSEVAAQVVINEFHPNSPEWVEFYNSSSDVINLSDFWFDDDDNFVSDIGTSSKRRLSGLLSGGATCYLDLNSYLNDNGDKPTIFSLSGEIIDSYSYISSLGDKTYSRDPDGGEWASAGMDPTKSLTNCLSLATPTPTQTPTPTPVSTSSSNSSSSKATVKINSAKDQNGNELLGSLKIYIDGNYTGNYAPETYTFCSDCKCGSNNVPCGFGNHTFKVEKTGYNSWTKTAEISADNNYEFDPVLTLVSSSPSPTLKATPTATASATPKSTTFNLSTSSESALLAEDVFSNNKGVLGAFSESKTSTPVPNQSDSKFKLAALFFIISGLSFLGSAVYAYLKKKKNAKPDESKSEEAG
ncbi:MAG: hypothetical protein KatS3mg088_366 [Patescibacteria group bacterium]|nr:MAG: hypothetical protein KatS3mg088_366 [Patescibacteria group bacterium]